MPCWLRTGSEPRLCLHNRPTDALFLEQKWVLGQLLLLFCRLKLRCSLQKRPRGRKPHIDSEGQRAHPKGRHILPTQTQSMEHEGRPVLFVSGTGLSTSR